MAIMFHKPLIRAIPYLRVNEGINIIKESIPVTTFSFPLPPQTPEPHTAIYELESHFTKKELHRLSYLLHKMSLFKPKIDSYELTEEFFKTNEMLHICMKRLNLLKFDNLPIISRESPDIAVDIEVPHNKNMPLRERNHFPILPELHGDHMLVYIHPAIVHLYDLREPSRLRLRKLLEENQRLEYYGDSVLGELVSSSVMRRFPSGSENLLTAVRSLLVQNDTLEVYAHIVGLPEILSKFTGKKPYSSKVLADCFESYIGRCKLEGGQAMQDMIVCLDELMEPIYNRIEANLACKYGFTKLKVENILCDWFNVDQLTRSKIRDRKLVDTNEKSPLPFVKMPKEAPIAQKIVFPKTTLECDDILGKSAFQLEADSSYASVQNSQLVDVIRNDKPSTSNTRRANEILKLLSERSKIDDRMKKFNRPMTLTRKLKNRKALTESELSENAPLPTFEILNSSGKIICKIFIADSLISKGSALSLEKSKKKLIRNMWRKHGPQLVKHYSSFL